MTGRWISVVIVFFTLNLYSQTVDTISKVDTLVTVGRIKITGNKITRDKIITRELEFHSGEQLTISELRKKIVKSRENLLNRQLFNFVTIETSDSGDYRNISIDVVERWYIWPVPILGLADRNFNVWWETKDFSRVNYGVDLKDANFRGRMEKLHLFLQGGYDKKIVGKWVIPYLNKHQNLGMTLAGGLKYNHETAFKDTLNRPVFYRFEDDFARKNYFGELGFSFRPGFNSLHYFTITYNNLWYNDSLLLFNPDLTYGKDHYQYFDLFYKFKLDYRDYAPYPLNGYYFDFSLRKTGLGILSKDVDLWSSTFNFDQYFQIYKRFYFAYRITAFYSNQEKFQPYFLTTGIGFDDFEMRGYELVVVRGQKMLLFRSNVKFELIPMKVHRIKFIKSEKFGKLFYASYLNLFFDTGYADDQQTFNNNPLGNKMLWTLGAGLDIISFYSIVIRLEYSINRQKETGFYVAFVAPI